jgi:hypothetical protein
MHRVASWRPSASRRPPACSTPSKSGRPQVVSPRRGSGPA